MGIKRVPRNVKPTEAMERALDRAISLSGGPRALSRRLGISPQAISYWKICPQLRVIELEKITEKQVTRYELRPDLYPSD